MPSNLALFVSVNADLPSSQNLRDIVNKHWLEHGSNYEDVWQIIPSNQTFW